MNHVKEILMLTLHDKLFQECSIFLHKISELLHIPYQTIEDYLQQFIRKQFIYTTYQTIEESLLTQQIQSIQIIKAYQINNTYYYIDSHNQVYSSEHMHSPEYPILQKVGIYEPTNNLCYLFTNDLNISNK